MKLSVISSSTILECSVFNVEKAIIDQDGVIYRREVIRHPGSAVIVPLFEDGTVALVEQYRHAAGENLLELPAGSLEEGESPSDCASREIVEETGYAAERLEKIVEFYVSPGFLDEKMHIFLATGLSPASALPDIDEVIKVRKIHLDRALEMVTGNEIKDAKTMIGLRAASDRLLHPW